MSRETILTRGVTLELVKFRCLGRDQGRAEIVAYIEFSFAGFAGEHYSRETKLPRPNGDRQETLLPLGAPNVNAKLEWGEFTRLGVTVVSLKVTLADRYFVAIQQPDDKEFWLSCPRSTHDGPVPAFGWRWDDAVQRLKKQ